MTYAQKRGSCCIKEKTQFLTIENYSRWIIDREIPIFKDNGRNYIESRIQELEVMLENAVIITEVDTNKVSIGTCVKLEFVGDDEVETYSIVGTKEADPFENKISNESPIAKAIMGKKVGDVATVNCDDNSYDVKILEIQAQ